MDSAHASQSRSLPSLIPLFADAERLEDPVQKVVGGDGADDFSKLGQRGADFHGDLRILGAIEGVS